MMISLAGFRKFVEDDTHSLEPKSSKKDSKDDKDDYLDSLDDELGADWKKDVLNDLVVVLEPIEIGNYVYKTSAWRVLDTDEDHVTIQLEPDAAPNLVHNVFRRTEDGGLERLRPHGPFDTKPHRIPRESFAKIQDAALRAAAQGGGGGAPPGGGLPGMGGPPGAPPGGPGGPPPPGM